MPKLLWRHHCGIFELNGVKLLMHEWLFDVLFVICFEKKEHCSRLRDHNKSINESKFHQELTRNCGFLKNSYNIVLLFSSGRSPFCNFNVRIWFQTRV